MRLLLGAAITALVLSLAFAAAIFSGLISVGPAGVSTAVGRSNIASSTPQPARQASADTVPATSPGAESSTDSKAAITKQEAIGDWIYTCIAIGQRAEVRCSIAQQISAADTKATLFVWRIAQDGSGGLSGIWQTPESVLLHRGISLDAGTAKPIVVPYETCGKGRCRAVASLAADYVETLISSQKLTATIVTRDGQELALPLSVKGLADGLAALKTATPAATTPPATAPPAN